MDPKLPEDVPLHIFLLGGFFNAIVVAKTRGVGPADPLGKPDPYHGLVAQNFTNIENEVSSMISNIQDNSWTPDDRRLIMYQNKRRMPELRLEANHLIAIRFSSRFFYQHAGRQAQEGTELKGYTHLNFFNDGKPSTAEYCIGCIDLYLAQSCRLMDDYPCHTCHKIIDYIEFRKSLDFPPRFNLQNTQAEDVVIKTFAAGLGDE